MVQAWEFVEEYDDHVLLPPLVKVNQHLNMRSMEVSDDTKIGSNEVVDFLFDAPATTEEVGILGLLVSELSLYERLAIPRKKEVAPLKWWKENTHRFPNVGFLAKQLLAILGS